MASRHLSPVATIILPPLAMVGVSSQILLLHLADRGIAQMKAARQARTADDADVSDT